MNDRTDSTAVLAAAKAYARASAYRAVHGMIPEWDGDADNANWERATLSVRKDCLAMAQAILIAAEFPQRQAAAAARAIAILDRESNQP